MINGKKSATDKILLMWKG